MIVTEPLYEARLARDAAEVEAAQRLRYQVFVEELGAAGGPLADHARRLERDAHDPHCDHLILLDHARDGQVVGVYRLMSDAAAAAGPGFYTAGEYDLSPLLGSGRRLLELGRSCLHPDFRGGAAMYHLWSTLAEHVTQQGVEVLFGVASFPGTDLAALALPLAHLHHAHLAPPGLRARSRVFQPMDLVPAEAVDRKAAMLATPALIKAYLRLGGFVGEGAFVDHGFNTTDVFLVMDTALMNARSRDIYRKGRA